MINLIWMQTEEKNNYTTKIYNIKQYRNNYKNIYLHLYIYIYLHKKNY